MLWSHHNVCNIINDVYSVKTNLHTCMFEGFECNKYMYDIYIHIFVGKIFVSR
jgi:hypothetical protein